MRSSWTIGCITCLQPPLETLLGRDSLAFPFRPFPYQFEGVAFFIRGMAAILADEMGLGKTMQAITAVRLLLHAGEISTVLLVCPKPLVTNWQREFALWAPELPITVIEGEQAKRRWQWQLAEAPIKIANYEVAAARSRRWSDDGSLQFRPGDSRRSPADQKPRQPHQPGRARDRPPPQLGPDRHAGREQPGRSGRHFRILAPGHLSPTMKPRRMGQAASDYVLRRTKDKVLTELPPKMFRDAQFELTAEQRETYQLAEEEGVLRLTDMGDAATIQHVFELVLRLKQICNFDPATGQRQVRTAGGRLGRSRRQRPQGDRLQPMGRHAAHAARAVGALRPARVSRPGAAAPDATA